MKTLHGGVSSFLPPSPSFFLLLLPPPPSSSSFFSHVSLSPSVSLLLPLSLSRIADTVLGIALVGDATLDAALDDVHNQRDPCQDPPRRRTLRLELRLEHIRRPTLFRLVTRAVENPIRFRLVRRYALTEYDGHHNEHF